MTVPFRSFRLRNSAVLWFFFKFFRTGFMFSMSAWFHWIDLAGVAVFAISGTLMAHRKYMDGFGVIVLAGVTAIGGGTLRDMILDLPVFWVRDPSFFYVILLAAFATIVWIRYNEHFPLRYLLVADAFGLAFFNLMGLQKAIAFGASPLVAIALGTMTGVFGGLLRDVICREIPLVLKGELYATACILGGAMYMLLIEINVNTEFAMLMALLTTLITRLGAMKWNWHLPVFPNHLQTDPKGQDSD